MNFRFLHRPFAVGAKKQYATALGPLETNVMTILWTRGQCSVREVAGDLDRSLAYTTVMTTLDRLFKKGLLDRRKSDRAFLYSPRISRSEWEGRIARDLVDKFLAASLQSRDRLLSFFVDAAGRYDNELLNDLENKIRIKRKQRSRRGEP